MGKMVTVWSSTKKTGKTIFLYSLIHQVSRNLGDDVKVLVCCANAKQGNLMELFNVDKKELNLEDMVNFKLTSGGDIGIFEAMAKRNKLYFAGSKKTSQVYAARNIRNYEELFRDFKGYFDLILVDVPSGKENILTNMLIQKSEYVLNVLCQDKESLDMCPFVTDKDIAYVVNFYMEIYPQIRDISSLYKLKGRMFTLPLCSGLQEMKNKGKLALYMQHNTEFNSSMKNISDFLIEELGMKIQSGITNTGKKRRLLKNIVANVMGEAYE